MFENSYDVPGLKFGVVVSPVLRNVKMSEKDSKSRDKLIEEIFQSRHYCVTDFKDVDGLTIDDILRTFPECQTTDTVLFIIYNSLNVDNSDNIKSRALSYYLFIGSDDKNISIDKIIEKYFLKNYNQGNDNWKKMIKCFLQRYNYRCKSRVDQVIKEKVLKQNNN